MSRAELHTKHEQRLDSKAAAGSKLATYIFQPDRPVGQIKFFRQPRHRLYVALVPSVDLTPELPAPPKQCDEGCRVLFPLGLAQAKCTGREAQPIEWCMVAGLSI
jgi:hypothetical protein